MIVLVAGPHIFATYIFTPDLVLSQWREAPAWEHQVSQNMPSMFLQIIKVHFFRDMIFPVAHLLSFISHKFSLSPGDLVLTGTPAGARKPPVGGVHTSSLLSPELSITEKNSPKEWDPLLLETSSLPVWETSSPSPFLLLPEY